MKCLAEDEFNSTSTNSYYIQFRMNDNFLNKLLESSQNVQENVLSLAEAQGFLNGTLAILFPHFAEKHFNSSDEINRALKELQLSLENLLSPYCHNDSSGQRNLAENFFNDLPAIYEVLNSDAEAIYQGDPAAKSVDEVIIAYPGFFAIAVYRLAHWFYQNKVPLLPRIMTEYAHKVTGIDIHPGASISKSFFIDHGTGIVIGETTVIEENVKIYQGVTLGALSVDKSMSSSKRHPTIQKNVIIYANATILGGETVIGHDSIIGGNVWLTESIAPGSSVFNKQKPAVISKKR